MKTQRFRLHLFDARQKILVRSGAYTCIVANVKAEVERRNQFWSPEAHRYTSIARSCESGSQGHIGYESEISIQNQPVSKEEVCARFPQLKAEERKGEGLQGASSPWEG